MYYLYSRVVTYTLASDAVLLDSNAIPSVLLATSFLPFPMYCFTALVTVE